MVLRSGALSARAEFYALSLLPLQDVPLFGPPLPRPAIFEKDATFKDFLLAKMINAELAAYRTLYFSKRLRLGRRVLLENSSLNLGEKARAKWMITGREEGVKLLNPPARVRLCLSRESSPTKSALSARAEFYAPCLLPLQPVFFGKLFFSIPIHMRRRTIFLPPFPTGRSP